MSSRAPFNVLVFPCRISDSRIVEFAVFRRSDEGWWQGIAGGGEGTESPLAAAQRETLEEAGIPKESQFLVLDTCNSIPATSFSGHLWGQEVIVIPEYTFGVKFDGAIRLSDEHLEYKWLTLEETYETLLWHTNKIAVWELAVRVARLYHFVLTAP